MKAVAEAPTKVIITGEHFVVHGAWALAAALPRKVRVEVTEGSAYGVTSDKVPGSSPDLAPLGRVVEEIGREYSVGTSVRVRVFSEVPEGAGLGSSASTMVALASAFAKLHSIRLGVEELIRFSMAGEKEVHGKPSGIDPAVCALGGVVLFRPGSRPKKVRLRGRRTVIVSFSGVKRSTRGQIGRVSQAREEHPWMFGRLAESISRLSLSASEMLVRGDLEGLGRVLAIDHAALDSVGVSNDALDSLVDLMVSLGCYGAKLTGGGGGGSVVGVAPKAKEKSIVSGLSARGFETFAANLPTEGVESWLER